MFTREDCYKQEVITLIKYENDNGNIEKSYTVKAYIGPRELKELLDDNNLDEIDRCIISCWVYDITWEGSLAMDAIPEKRVRREVDNFFSKLFKQDITGYKETTPLIRHEEMKKLLINEFGRTAEEIATWKLYLFEFEGDLDKAKEFIQNKWIEYGYGIKE